MECCDVAVDEASAPTTAALQLLIILCRYANTSTPIRIVSARWYSLSCSPMLKSIAKTSGIAVSSPKRAEAHLLPKLGLCNYSMFEIQYAYISRHGSSGLAFTVCMYLRVCAPAPLFGRARLLLRYQPFAPSGLQRENVSHTYYSTRCVKNSTLNFM